VPATAGGKLLTIVMNGTEEEALANLAAQQ
jgi:hypothetical protein